MHKPFAVFDIDGTIYRRNLLEEIFYRLVHEGHFPDEAGTTASAARSSWRKARHRESFDDYINCLVRLFVRHIKGVPVSAVADATAAVMEQVEENMYVFAREEIERLRHTHFLIAISGAPTELVRAFSRRLDFGIYHGSQFATADGVYTGEAVAGHIDKDKTLRTFVRRLGLAWEGSVAIGDTESDAPMLAMAERAIAFRPNKELLEIALREGWEIFTEDKDIVYQIAGVSAGGVLEIKNGFGRYSSSWQYDNGKA